MNAGNVGATQASSVQTIFEIRQVLAELKQCRSIVLNPHLKKEYDAIIKQLELLENSLLAKAPVASTLIQPMAMNDFKARIEQQNYLPQQAQAVAPLYSLNPQMVWQEQQNMEMAKQHAQVEALSLALVKEIQSKLMGQSLTPNQLYAEVKRWVQAQSTVPTALIDPITQKIAQLLGPQVNLV